jgi:hypothetical protein
LRSSRLLELALLAPLDLLAFRDPLVLRVLKESAVIAVSLVLRVLKESVVIAVSLVLRDPLVLKDLRALKE